MSVVVQQTVERFYILAVATLVEMVKDNTRIGLGLKNQVTVV